MNQSAEQKEPATNPVILEHFVFTHLPENLQLVSRPFCELAKQVAAELDVGPERSVALRKLLEAKDAAVRAAVVPGC